MSSCCEPTPDNCKAEEACPRCGAVGRVVQRETVGAMAALAVPAAVLASRSFRHCTTRTCPVVYYDNGGATLERQHVRVPVSAKDAGADVPLCYCFGHTRRTIAAEIASTGRSTASTAIAREIKAGRCACEVKNPSGRCCLGDVRAYEKRVVRSPPAAVADR